MRKKGSDRKMSVKVVPCWQVKYARFEKGLEKEKKKRTRVCEKPRQVRKWMVKFVREKVGDVTVMWDWERCTGKSRSEGLCKAGLDRPGTSEAAGQTIKSVSTIHRTSRAAHLPYIGS